LTARGKGKRCVLETRSAWMYTVDVGMVVVQGSFLCLRFDGRLLSSGAIPVRRMKNRKHYFPRISLHFEVFMAF